MPFQPINDDHAIQSAAFVVTLDKNLPLKAIETLVKSPLEWREDLPAMDFPQLLDMGLHPQTGAPVNRIIRGVEFSEKRRDGTASWQLTALGKEIRLDVALYTRWDPVWAKAGDILLSIVGQVGTVEPEELKVVGVGHTIVDVFYTDNLTPDYSELFRESDMMPPGIYKRGPLWHVHTGWFDEADRGRTLNQLNIGVAKGLSQVSPPVDRISVTISHNQIYQPTEPLKLEHSALQDAIFQMPVLHAANKKVLKSILTDAVQDRIKLNVK